jgi:4-amino-4-deoxy-L-arabinose transferase-like glycosyltransferase
MTFSLDTKSHKRIQILIAVSAALLFIPFLGGVHLFDWDEINFAESAREMIKSGDYLNVQIDYTSFWEKPPLFIWMQVLSMKIFGIHEFAARFPNAICGIVTLLVLFNIGRKLYNNRFGLIWAICHGGAWLPFVYFKSGIIDPWFNLFIFIGINYFIDYLSELKEGLHPGRLIRFLIYSAASLGLAVLTKGPVAILVFSLTFVVYFILIRGKMKLVITHILIFIGSLTLIGGFWFLLQILNGHAHVIFDFINYQIKLFSTKDSGHGGFLLYHFVVILLGVFPTALLAIPMLIKKDKGNAIQDLYAQWMQILFWVVIILFTIVKTKIVHYSSLCYFPLSFLAALYINGLIEKKRVINSILLYGISVIGLILAFIIAFIPFIDIFKSGIITSGKIHDNFAIAALQASGGWSLWEGTISILLIMGIILFALYMRKKASIIYFLYGFSTAFVLFVVLFYTAKIERYSQLAEIEFCEKLAGQQVYLETLDFRSYAIYYYFDKPKPLVSANLQPLWQLTGNLDKDAYFIVKNTSKDENMKANPELKYLYEKNGFVFLLRPKSQGKK